MDLTSLRRLDTVYRHGRLFWWSPTEARTLYFLGNAASTFTIALHRDISIFVSLERGILMIEVEQQIAKVRSREQSLRIMITLP